MYNNRNKRMSAMLNNYLSAQAKRDNDIARVTGPIRKQKVKATAKVLGRLEFIIQIKNDTLTAQDYLLFDSNDQYINNDPNAPTNAGVTITGQKKNYQGLLNQLTVMSYRLVSVNFEAVGSSTQLDHPIKVWTSSPDNDANVFQKTITPSLYKNSQQFQLALIETADDIDLNLFSAWTSVIDASASLIIRIFAESGRSFQ